jgi:hypothetical protein
MHPAAYQAALWLADDSDGGGESKKSGPLGLVVIIVLCVVCYFLFKSMSKHLKRVREDFPDGKPAPPPAADPVAPAQLPASTPMSPARASDPDEPPPAP